MKRFIQYMQSMTALGYTVAFSQERNPHSPTGYTARITMESVTKSQVVGRADLRWQNKIDYDHELDGRDGEDFLISLLETLAEEHNRNRVEQANVDCAPKRDKPLLTPLDRVLDQYDREKTP